MADRSSRCSTPGAIDRVDPGGHGHGGPARPRFAAAHPGRVRRLVRHELPGPVGRGDLLGDPRPAAVRLEPADPASAARAPSSGGRSGRSSPAACACLPTSARTSGGASAARRSGLHRQDVRGLPGHAAPAPRAVRADHLSDAGPLGRARQATSRRPTPSACTRRSPARGSRSSPTRSTGCRGIWPTASPARSGRSPTRIREAGPGQYCAARWILALDAPPAVYQTPNHGGSDDGGQEGHPGAAA